MSKGWMETSLATLKGDLQSRQKPTFQPGKGETVVIASGSAAGTLGIVVKLDDVQPSDRIQLGYFTPHGQSRVGWFKVYNVLPDTKENLLKVRAKCR